MPRQESTPTSALCRERRQITDRAMRVWIQTAAAGDRIEYHRGFLAIDIDPSSSTFAKPKREELARVAALARRSADVGRLHLFQQRLGDSRFSYFAVASP
jgi:hypothetical protein